MSSRGSGERTRREAVPEVRHDGKGGARWGMAEPIILKGIKSSDLLLS